MAQQKPREALDAFSAALRLQPDVFEALRGQGEAYEALGQVDRAVESYRRALALNGEDPVALNNLAWVLSEHRKKPDEALPLAQKAVQRAPQAPEMLDTLGWVQYRRGAYAEAEKALAQAAERAPNSGITQYHLGMAYSRLGRKADAVSALRRAAQLDPKLAQAERIEAVIKGLGG